MGSKTTPRTIGYNILIRIYKRFKRNPLKIFTVSDFLQPKRYIETLIRLGLIEEVKAVYKTGYKSKIGIKHIKGYRLNLKQTLTLNKKTILSRRPRDKDLVLSIKLNNEKQRKSN